MLRLASCATALVLLAACSSGHEPKAIHVEAFAEESLTATASQDLGPAQQSGVESLPVPRIAARTTGVKTCSAPNCTEEYWSVPATTAHAVREWYATQLEETDPWRDWHPCAGPDANEVMPLVYQWAKAGISLELQVTEPNDAALIHIRSEATDLPCN